MVNFTIREKDSAKFEKASGSRLRRSKSAILRASTRSFFFLEVAIARSIAGWATFSSLACGRRKSYIQPVNNVASMAPFHGRARRDNHSRRTWRVARISPSAPQRSEEFGALAEQFADSSPLDAGFF